MPEDKVIAPPAPSEYFAKQNGNGKLPPSPETYFKKKVSSEDLLTPQEPPLSPLRRPSEMLFREEPEGQPPFAFPSVNKEELKKGVEEGLKQIHEQSGYQWERGANVIEKVEGEEVPAPVSMEDVHQYLEGVRFAIDLHPNSDPVTKVIAKSYVNSAEMLAQGLHETVNAKQGDEIKNAWQAFELPAALVKTGFGAASLAVPQLIAFNATVAGAEEVLPSDLVGYALAPIQTLREKGGIVAIPMNNNVMIFDIGQTGDEKQAAAELTDLLFQILVFHGAKGLANKVVKNIPLTPIEANEVNRLVDEGFKDATYLNREALSKVSPDLTIESKAKVAPLIEEKQALTDKRQEIEKAKAKLDETQHQIEDKKIADIDTRIEEIKSQISETIKPKTDETKIQESEVRPAEERIQAEAERATEEIISPIEGEAKPKEEVASPSLPETVLPSGKVLSSEGRNFAVEMVKNDLVERGANVRTEKMGGIGKRVSTITDERLDLEMTSAERNKAIADIKKGDYETAPAKKMIDKLTEFYDNDSFDVIRGTGGKTERFAKRFTKEEMTDAMESIKIERENRVKADQFIPNFSEPVRVLMEREELFTTSEGRKEFLSKLEDEIFVNEVLKSFQNEFTRAEIGLIKETLNDIQNGKAEFIEGESFTGQRYRTIKYREPIQKTETEATEPKPIPKRPRESAKAKGVEPEADFTPFTLSEKQSARKSRIAELRNQRKSIDERLGAIEDPFDKARQKAEIDRKIFDEYLDMARDYVAEGVKTIQDFAKQIGEEIDDIIRRAWDAATGVKKHEDAIKEIETTPEITVPKEVRETTQSGEPKSILNRLSESENISESAKAKFEKEGLRYKPHSHEEARSLATEIVKGVGEDAAVNYAEAGRFSGDINSSIFAVAIDRIALREAEARKAGNTKAADSAAEKWADYAIRYDEAARSGGRFTSQIYDFYKKSPLGVRIKEQKIRQEAFEQWYKTKEEAYKEFWGELTRNPQFQDVVKTAASSYKAKAKKVADKIREGKIADDIMMAGVPFVKEVWNGAIEASAKIIEAGGKIADALEAGVKHIQNSEWYKKLTPENQSKAESRFTKKFTESSKETPSKKIKKEDEDKIISKWSKKLKGLPEAKKEQFIRDIVSAVVQKGELKYADFKKILSDAVGLGKITVKEVEMIDKYVEAANKVTELGEKAQKEGTEKSIQEFDEAVILAERSQTDLASVLYKEPNLTNRITSLISLNTLGLGSLFANAGFNISQQALLRFPKALIGTAMDYTAFGMSLAANKAFGTPILKPETNVFLAQRGYFKGLGRGSKEVARKIRRGGTYKDYFNQGIQHPTIKPFQSIRYLRAWNFGKGEKALNNKEIADKLLQATSGVPAEIIARGLLTGDVPPRWAAESAKAEQLALLKFGIKDKNQIELFKRFPEEQAKKEYLKKGLSEEQAQTKAADIKKQILEAGDDAALTMDNIATEMANYLKRRGEELGKDNPVIKDINSVLRVFGVLNVPYLKIPVNAVWLAMNLRNPILAMSQSAYYGYKFAKTKDPAMARKAKDWLQVAAVGVAVNTVAAWMANNEIITPRNTPQESKKEGEITNEYDRQFSMNVHKLLRGGGDTEDGDFSIDLKWFGAVGAATNVAAQKREKELEEGEMSAMDELGFNLSRGGIDGFTENVFGGVGALASAYSMGGGYVNQVMLQYTNLLSNVFEPAMVAQISRNGFGRQMDFRGETLGDAVSKNLYHRTWGAIGQRPETKLGVFGEEQQREGNYLGRVLTGLIGAEIADTEKLGYPIYEMYNETHNSYLVPPITPKKLTVDGKPTELTLNQQRDLQAIIGATRIELVAAFLNNQASLYSAQSGASKYMFEMTTEEIAKTLKAAYDKGGDLGTEKFKLLYPEFQSNETETSEREVGSGRENESIRESSTER